MEIKLNKEEVEKILAKYLSERFSVDINKIDYFSWETEDHPDNTLISYTTIDLDEELPPQ